MKKSSMTNLFRWLIVLGVIITLSGCAAVQTSVAKRNLDVQTKVSTSIFVDAVKRDKRIVYVDIRSAVMEFDRNAMSKIVRDEFANNANGYRITDDPDAAQYQMNIFVRQLEKASPTAAEAAVRDGYSDVKTGTVAGAAIGASSGRSTTGAAAGGLLGALGTTAANAFVQDVTYMLVADVLIKEKARKGVIVRKDTKISTQVSDSGTSSQSVIEASKHKEYATRIVTTANQANLELEEAQPLMFKKTAYAMSSFF